MSHSKVHVSTTTIPFNHDPTGEPDEYGQRKGQQASSEFQVEMKSKIEIVFLEASIVTSGLQESVWGIIKDNYCAMQGLNITKVIEIAKNCSLA